MDLGSVIMGSVGDQAVLRDAIPVTGKNAKVPDEWRPPDPVAWCTYAEWWVQVKAKWELTVAAGEVDILMDMLETCP